MVTYGIDTPVECWTAGGFFVSGAVGGVMGGLTAGLGNAVAPFLSKVVTAAAARATPALKGALSKVTTLFKPRASVVDDVLEGACSFAGVTAVVLADGSTKPIEDIEVGDEVLAEDPVTGERGAHKVSHVWVHEDSMVDFQVEGGVVTTTEDHPLWNATDRLWEGPEDFDRGDRVLTADGNLLVTDGLVPESWVTGSAFNLTVEDLHTYFVVIADKGVLVHNTCPWPDGSVVPTDDVLDAAVAHLGEGYTEVADGVFRSAVDDVGGFTQFRITPADLYSRGGAHANFETMVPRPGTVRMPVSENIHVYLLEGP